MQRRMEPGLVSNKCQHLRRADQSLSKAYTDWLVMCSFGNLPLRVRPSTVKSSEELLNVQAVSQPTDQIRELIVQVKLHTRRE